MTHSCQRDNVSGGLSDCNYLCRPNLRRVSETLSVSPRPEGLTLPSESQLLHQEVFLLRSTSRSTQKNDLAAPWVPAKED